MYKFILTSPLPACSHCAATLRKTVFIVSLSSPHRARNFCTAAVKADKHKALPQNPKRLARNLPGDKIFLPLRALHLERTRQGRLLMRNHYHPSIKTSEISKISKFCSPQPRAKQKREPVTTRVYIPRSFFYSNAHGDKRLLTACALVIALFRQLP